MVLALLRAVARRSLVAGDDVVTDGWDRSKPGRAQALYGVGMLAWYQGDLEGAADPTEASVALFREHGDKKWLATALRLLGLIWMGQGTPPAARPILTKVTLCSIW